MANTNKDLEIPREELIARLTEESSQEILEAARGYTLDAIRDMKSFRGGKNQKKSYFWQKYGKDVGSTLSGPYNYCMAIQMYGLNKASKDIGQDIQKELGKNKTLNDFLYFDTRAPRDVCRGDTTQLKTSGVGIINNMGEYIDKGQTKKKTLSDFINKDGTVKKDANGKPLLRTNDIVVIESSTAPSGWHVLAVYVDNNGKAKYYAGNAEHIDESMLASHLQGKEVQIMHTDDYCRAAVKNRYEKMTDEQLYALAQSKYPDILKQEYKGSEQIQLATQNVTTQRGTPAPVVEKNKPTTPTRSSASRQELIADIKRDVSKSQVQYACQMTPGFTGTLIKAIDPSFKKPATSQNIMAYYNSLAPDDPRRLAINDFASKGLSPRCSKSYKTSVEQSIAYYHRIKDEDKDVLAEIGKLKEGNDRLAASIRTRSTRRRTTTRAYTQRRTQNSRA